MGHALGYSPYNTCVGSWYGLIQSFCHAFSPAQGRKSTPALMPGHSCFQLVLMMTITPQSYTVR